MNLADRDVLSRAVADPIGAVAATPAAQTLRERVESGGALSLAGVAEAAMPFVAAMIHRLFPTRTMVVVTESLKVQEQFQQDYETWSKGRDGGGAKGDTAGRTLFYPAWEILPNEEKLPHADVISDRLETLVALRRHRAGAEAPVVMTNISALLQKTLAATQLEQCTRAFKRGDSIDPMDLIEWLEDQGYEPEAQVTQRGEIALRGGIVDVYPLTSPWPVRLEFFGNDLESLRYFDPTTQISREEIPEIVLPPGGELGIMKRLVRDGARPSECIATFFDQLPADTIVLLANLTELQQHGESYVKELGADNPFFLNMAEWETRLQRGAKSVVCFGEELPLSFSGEAARVTLELESLETYRSLGDRPPEAQVAEAQRREFFQQLHRWQRQDYSMHVVCNNDGESQRFKEIWAEYGLGELKGVTIDLGALSRGFLSDEAKLAVVTDAEIFGRYKVQRPRRMKTQHAKVARSAMEINFTELEFGDYVVHLQHGIGKYLGLQVLPISGGRKRPREEQTPEVMQECLVIEYAASTTDQAPPKLYVPVTEAHLVGKYVGAGKARPQLNTLGGNRWAKAKEQAQRAVRDLAGELLTIQAARASQPGYAFGPDTPWQREFEGSFLYEETIDQVKAIDAAKKDMEVAKPMDRLICGDVGFGKTEVAIRAAFKAVMGGKQVAIMVPTTVLAQQHYRTFRERMADYPVKVELLSRFRTKKEQAKVIEDLATGAVDIVVGTHRVVQSDIVFKDLGLVVVDEEQRFGVMHKEKFKLMRKLVDVLTLSATPIPRTLHLALTGARDMSTIETPPHDRLPVETVVTQYDERMIRDAILREMQRDGQVFFLHNRVSTIDMMATKLRTLVPDARIVVGHGQMDADDLEEVMTAFVNGEADVLLSTTIIESGLDIPNANTIIIDRADRFGLSELYQLRGRVGRYKHQAYAYLMIPRHASLLSDARKRMSAIKQYSKLGSGFKIAMRDLEIRGAGNLLGAQQSGHITAVGFELYCQLLKQSVSALKGEKVKPRVEVPVRLDFLDTNPKAEAVVSGEDDEALEEESEKLPKGRVVEIVRPGLTQACIPLSYIPESQQRVDMYRKIAQVTEYAELEAVRKELRDRFGKLPEAMDLLLRVSELKVMAVERKISSIEAKEGKLMITRNNDFIMLGGKFPRLTKKAALAKVNEIKKLLLAI
ncbi:MAG TPA: transcription-repair coupling factor [Verrucomicrobiae bacterium]